MRSAKIRIASAIQRRKRRGFMTLDLLAAVGLMLVVFILFMTATHHYAAARRETDARRMLLLVADAELNRLRAGADDSAQPFRPAGVSVETATRPGQQAWQGLTLVTVTARTQILGGKWVSHSVAGYMRPRPDRQP